VRSWEEIYGKQDKKEEAEKEMEKQKGITQEINSNNRTLIYRIYQD
jgi:hypothetical protein